VTDSAVTEEDGMLAYLDSLIGLAAIMLWPSQ
jgi:hypothetical protein